MSSENIFYVVNWSKSDVFSDFIKITNRNSGQGTFQWNLLQWLVWLSLIFPAFGYPWRPPNCAGFSALTGHPLHSLVFFGFALSEFWALRSFWEKICISCHQNQHSCLQMQLRSASLAKTTKFLQGTYEWCRDSLGKISWGGWVDNSCYQKEWC